MRRILPLVVAVAVGASCASSPDADDTPAAASPTTDLAGIVEDPEVPDVSDVSEVPAVDASALPAMNVVASLGYPRDLLDRGRVNVKISREGDEEFVVLDKQIVSDDFEPTPSDERRTVVPPDGRVVAVQTLIGDVSDCDGSDPVSAELLVTFTYGDDATVKQASVPFTDATTLDQIRFQRCTVRQVLADNEIVLRDPVVDGETMTVDLAIERRRGDAELAFDSIKGTVLFGAATDPEPGSPERILDPDEDTAVIPLAVDVNRCDSHAVAETTRKFGLDLYVSVDGAESQRVEVPVDPIVDDLEAMLERCKERTGQ